jgi:hypothetical protein
VVWFISFGDLLTLLLCFFLVLTPWDRLKKSSNTESLPTVTAQSDTIDNPGTTLASDLPLRGSVIALELPLFEGEGGLSGEGLSSAALSRELTRAMPSGGRIDVLVCSGADVRAAVVRFVGEAVERSFGSGVSARFVVRRSCEVSQDVVETWQRKRNKRLRRLKHPRPPIVISEFSSPRVVWSRC